MWWRRKARAGKFLEQRQDAVTLHEIETLIKQGHLRVMVPVDPRVSPWGVPKGFVLSRKQALEYFRAAESGTDEFVSRVSWYFRSDNILVLVPRGMNAAHDPNRLPYSSA